MFEIDDHVYQIPEHFSTTEVLGYRSLLAPVPDNPRGTTMSAELRVETEAVLFRRAAACVIPRFGMNAPESLSRAQLESIHRWIDRHRPALSANQRTRRFRA
jgi:hypothetical protein